MNEIQKKKEGIIAYFDILGYQNFIENNKIEDCISIIENIILKLPEETKNERFGFYTGSNEIMNSVNKYFNEHCNVTFLSDTMLFFFDFKSVGDNYKPLFIHQIFIYLLFFMQKTFEAGFPMRGYIDYGEYYYKNDKNMNVVAGETVVNCHREANDLEFSGLIVSDELFEKHYLYYIKEIEENKYHDKYLIKEERFMTISRNNVIKKYLINTKKGEKEKYIVNFLLDFHRSDITQYIFESFHKHNKIINDNVMGKIQNTEKLFRYFVYNNSIVFH